MAKIGIIGAGSWGIALAVLLNENGHAVTVWTHSEAGLEKLLSQRELKDKLPGVQISEQIVITNQMEETMKEKALCVMAVPSPCMRETAEKMKSYTKKGQIVVCVSKGLEEDTLLTLSEVIKQELPMADVAVLCGPSHAEEVAHGLPTALVAGASSRKTAEYIQSVFMNEYLRVYTSPDVMGMEMGGALKNVIALAAGMADGLGYGDNTKAALITRGVAEIERLAVKMGGRPETLSGLTGMGDLIVTCESRHSRNRKAGMLIGQGMTAKEAMKEVRMVVEGVNSAKAALLMAEKYQVSMPIIQQVNEVLFCNRPAAEAVKELMIRDKKIENANLQWEAED